MANNDVPTGLSPVAYLSGAPYNGAANLYYVGSGDSTAIFVGDPVKMAGSADADGVPSVAQAAAGDTILGVVIAVMSITRDSVIYRQASTERYVWVADDPNLVFEVQEDSIGGALAATSVGQNYDLIIGAGNTQNGLSGVEIDSSTGTTSTAQVRVMRLASKPDNEIGANAKWLVRIVEHFNTSATGV